MSGQLQLLATLTPRNEASIPIRRKLRGPQDRSLGIFSEATDGTMCPGVDSASKNEYQENSWE